MGYVIHPKKAPYFGDVEQDPPVREELAPVLDVDHFRRAIVRVLQLRLLTTDVRGENFEYHWTYLGKVMLSKLFPGDNVIDRLNPDEAGCGTARRTRKLP